MAGPISPLPDAPGPMWRLGSTAVMGIAGVLCRAFLCGLNNVETVGLDNFLRVLDDRKANGRERGLITACNHVSVLDDPVMWGVLPLRYAFDPRNLRWGLGAHDICFKNRISATYFSLGQILPTYRFKHSPHGGLYQPTVTEAIRLLSGTPSSRFSPSETARPSSSSASTTTTAAASDTLVPHPHGNLSWVHLFPEGCVHQHPASSLRYFKWGISRLILESDPTPSFLPIFIDGTQDLMPEDRAFPRFLPRVGKKIRVVFGDEVDVDHVFGDQIARWNEIKHLVRRAGPASAADDDDAAWGQDAAEALKEAARIRIEVARRARGEVAKLRLRLGYPPDDEELGLAETWARERARSPKTAIMEGGHVSTKR